MSSKIEFNPTQSCREGEGELMKGEGIEGMKGKEREGKEVRHHFKPGGPRVFKSSKNKSSSLELDSI